MISVVLDIMIVLALAWALISIILAVIGANSNE